ncbi:uncharacterized protein AMSG_11679 [Thecamonas trahens ATCC 50062]|uniref:Uncharacterized protein n=1 Tax=Thecamonas trahens ATCC 50062 TaxID=461836 RepID=A0A0L0DUG4_THETB|nr:hypothetical protein AMSG_11679 [Thecamonas trahens ATCC 50062]KNC55696.1 hypothetical protein AMSG_11679 [Thecamonas trahens ATCC 50062]|eukprot:XP_013761485.1 hypothetical protein AMSG_11679 [Thecamonas trahens ATCC 50062]
MISLDDGEYASGGHTLADGARFGHTSVSNYAQTKVFVFGGYGASGLALDSVVVGKVVRDGVESWQRMGRSKGSGSEVPRGRAWHAAVQLGGYGGASKMVVIGGEYVTERGVQYLGDVWELETEREEWRAVVVRGKFEARSMHSAVAVGLAGGDGGSGGVGLAGGSQLVYVFGGRGRRGYLDDVVSYNGVSRVFSSVTGHSASAVGKFMYVFGGRSGGGLLGDLARLDVQSGEWSQVLLATSGELPLGRFGGVMCMGGERMVVYGGWTESGGCGWANDVWHGEVEEEALGPGEVGEGGMGRLGMRMLPGVQQTRRQAARAGRAVLARRATAPVVGTMSVKTPFVMGGSGVALAPWRVWPQACKVTGNGLYSGRAGEERRVVVAVADGRGEAYEYALGARQRIVVVAAGRSWFWGSKAGARMKVATEAEAIGRGVYGAQFVLDRIGVYEVAVYFEDEDHWPVRTAIARRVCEVTAGEVDAAQSVVLAEPKSSVSANEMVEWRVALRDEHGNPVAGSELEASPAGGRVMDHGDGTYTALWAFVHVGQYSLALARAGLVAPVCVRAGPMCGHKAEVRRTSEAAELGAWRRLLEVGAARDEWGNPSVVGLCAEAVGGLAATKIAIDDDGKAVVDVKSFVAGRSIQIRVTLAGGRLDVEGSPVEIVVATESDDEKDDEGESGSVPIMIVMPE